LWQKKQAAPGSMYCSPFFTGYDDRGLSLRGTNANQNAAGLNFQGIGLFTIFCPGIPWLEMRNATVQLWMAQFGITIDRAGILGEAAN
jgi:hypothetical protein